MSTERKLTRRALAKGAALAAGGAALHVDAADAHWRRHHPWRPEDDDDIALVNGNFLTLDGRDSRAGSVAIRGDRIVEVGRGRVVRGCKRTIDLRGATVIPGLIDSHQHFIRGCHNPGYETRGRRGGDVGRGAAGGAGRAGALACRSAGMLTCIGGWNRNGLAEKRLPTPAELNAAAPLHGVYLSETGGGGQAVTNSVGAAFFGGAGVAVEPTTGTLNAAAGRAALVAVQTPADKARGTREGIAWVELARADDDRRRRRRAVRRLGLPERPLARRRARHLACGSSSPGSTSRRSTGSRTSSTTTTTSSATTCSASSGSASG